MWEWTSTVQDNGGRNINLGQIQFIDMWPLSRDIAFNTAAWGVRKALYQFGWLVGWLAQTWTKKWFPVHELEMRELHWFTLEEGVQRLKKTGMLEWIYHSRPTHPTWESSEVIPFNRAVRTNFLRGAPASLKNSVITLL